MKELKVNLEPKNNVVAVLTGNAPSPVEEISFLYRGNLDSAINYIEGMNDFLKPENIVILIDYDSKTISLIENPSSSISKRIEGFLTKSDELESFCINQETLFNQNEIHRLFRMNRFLFLNQDNSKILQQLENFTWDRKQAGKNNDDQRGNVELALEQSLQSNIEKPFFVLEAEIFKGYP